jgi:hypothetical protein
MQTQQIDWKGLVEATIALFTVITAAISFANSQHLKAVRDEQKAVKADLSQVTQDGKELRAFLSSRLPTPPGR